VLGSVYPLLSRAMVDLAGDRTASSAWETRPQASPEHSGVISFRSERVVTDVASAFARGGVAYPLDVPR
jgi:hypothetical protein